MILRRFKTKHWCINFFLVALCGVVAATGAAAHQGQHESEPAQPVAAKTGSNHGAADADSTRLVMPQMNAQRGRKLFANKGCVACHAINGVGGHDATPLDAHTMEPVMNPFEFAAKMWRMAPAMIAAQEEGLGFQVLFTGQELADIIAFVHDDEEQHRFSEADITPRVRKMMNHTHGEPGGGSKMHGEEIGHDHGDDMQRKHHGD